MLCNECGKNEANVHLTHIVNGEKTESHLCDECAKKKQSFSNFSMENLFSAMLNNAFSGATYLPVGPCPNCKMTYEQFRNIGKFGCSQCIDTFKLKLMPAIKNIQGYDEHLGKIPKRAGGDYRLQKDIERLKAELKRMIELEEYEKAAELRDKIRELETK